MSPDHLVILLAMLLPEVNIIALTRDEHLAVDAREIRAAEQLKYIAGRMYAQHELFQTVASMVAFIFHVKISNKYWLLRAARRRRRAGWLPDLSL